MMSLPIAHAEETTQKPSASQVATSQQLVDISAIEAMRKDIPRYSSMAMHGEPALQGDWDHLPYANPEAYEPTPPPGEPPAPLQPEG